MEVKVKLNSIWSKVDTSVHFIHTILYYGFTYLFQEINTPEQQWILFNHNAPSLGHENSQEWIPASEHIPSAEPTDSVTVFCEHMEFSVTTHIVIAWNSI